MKLKLLACMTSLMLIAGAAIAVERPITYVPEGGYKPTVETRYVEASTERNLQPGEKSPILLRVIMLATLFYNV